MVNNISYQTKNLFHFASDFTAFKLATLEEMKRHYPENGDSWKTCDIGHLERCLLKSMSCMTHEYIQYNPSHLLDIANFCAMVWTRINDSSPTNKMGEN